MKPGDMFFTMDEAAIDAIDFIRERTAQTGHEWGGLIYYDKEICRYSYTEPVEGDEKSIEYGKMKRPPDGIPVEAVYHTHTGHGYNAYWFSFEDYLISEGHGQIPVYLGTIARKILVWDSSGGERIVREY